MRLVKREELRHVLSSTFGPTETEPGCVSCQLYQPLADPNVLRVVSNWKMQSDFFVTSGQMHTRNVYKKLLVLMELGCEPPTVEFYTVSELRGMGLVNAVRELAE